MSDVVIKTIIAEAGGDPAGMAAVAHVIANRAREWGMTPEQVVKQPGQFEGYSNPGSGSKAAQKDAKVLARAEQVWRGVTSGAIPDPTNGGLSFRSASAAKSMAAPNGKVNIGGNVFAKGSGSPQTALAAINDVAPPNPQQRPPALAYGNDKVRAITVNPDGTPDMVSGLNAKFPGLSFTQSPKTADEITGIKQPPAMPVPRVASIAPTVPQSLISHPVQTVRIDPMTGNPVGTKNTPDLQTALNALAAKRAQSIVPQVPTPAAPNAQPTGTGAHLGITPAQQAVIDGGYYALHPDERPSTQTAGITPAQRNALLVVPPRAYDKITNIPAPVQTAAVRPPTIDAANPLDNKYLGLTSTPRPPPPLAAIQQVTAPQPTQTYTTKQMQVSNPDYLNYIKAQNADEIGAGPGSFASLQSSLAAIKAPPKVITQTIRVPTPVYPSMAPQRPVPRTPLVQQHPLMGFLSGLFGGGGQVPQAPNAAPAAPAPVGYNGNANVYSGELAGANQGFGGVNALMPDSMNNSRWLTGY